MSRFPVTLVCGAPGSGKSTVISEGLKEASGDTVWITLTTPESFEGTLPGVTLCAVPFRGDEQEWAQDVIIELGRIAQSSEFSKAIWEVPPGVEPLWALDLFRGTRDGPGLKGLAYVPSIITVLDAPTLAVDLMSDELVEDWADTGLITDPASSIAECVVDQIEIADTLLLHRVDAVSEDAAARLDALLHRLNPGALRIAGSRGTVEHPVSLFDEVRRDGTGDDLEAWLACPSADEVLEAVADVHGISHLRITADRPFHPVRIWEVINQQWDGVLRSKGLLWVASRPKKAGWWSQVSGTMTVDWVPWMPGTMTHREWDALELPYSLKDDEWQDGLGARRQELVLIGIGIDLRPLNALIQRALLTDSELEAGEHAWRRFPDPFPSTP